MLDAYIIEEIRRKERPIQEQPSLPLPEPEPPPKHKPPEKPQRGVIVIDL